jgi:long-chain acyl-CoA synthetase
MLVQDGLERHAERTPEKTALVCGGRRLSYAELDAMANRLANALIAGGVRRGDRVAVYLPNSVEAAAAIFASLKASAAFVVVNRAVKIEKLAYILKNAEAAALIGDPRIAQDGTLEGLRARYLPAAVMLAGPGDFTAAFPAARPASKAIDLDLACLVYTSGSTGEPKGVMSDHSNVVFAAQSIISYLKNTAEDVVINALPLSFDYGLYQLLMTTMFGGTLVLERGFVFPAELLGRIAAERVTGFPGVPTMFAALLALDAGGFDLSSLRYITNTAAALPPSHIEALRRKFPGVAIYSMYGLTETKRTLYLPPEQLDARPDSVGVPIPGTEAWVEGLDGARLGPDEVGELVVRGRHVMRGYWRDPEETARRFRPGPIAGERVCYTGDLFRMDKEGYFYFAGRRDDIIKTRGEKVAPKEIENVLHKLDGVFAAAVVGVPDPLLGQAVKAVLVADRSRVTAQRVLAHCRAHLEDFMVPKLVEFRRELPVGPSGKVLKRELVECAESLG